MPVAAASGDDDAVATGLASRLRLKQVDAEAATSAPDSRHRAGVSFEIETSRARTSCVSRPRRHRAGVSFEIETQRMTVYVACPMKSPQGWRLV